MNSEITAGEWKAFQLSPDSDKKERCIVTTKDGDVEICGIINNKADALVLGASKKLLEALKLCKSVLEGVSIAVDSEGVAAVKTLPIDLALSEAERALDEAHGDICWRCRMGGRP